MADSTSATTYEFDADMYDWSRTIAGFPAPSPDAVEKSMALDWALDEIDSLRAELARATEEAEDALDLAEDLRGEISSLHGQLEVCD